MKKNKELIPKENTIICISDFVNEQATFSHLYEFIASKLGMELPEEFVFDCRKLEVCKEIQDCIFTYYTSTGKYSSLDISSFWIVYGPKTNEYLHDFNVLVCPGFIARSEEEMMCDDDI